MLTPSRPAAFRAIRYGPETVHLGSWPSIVRPKMEIADLYTGYELHVGHIMAMWAWVDVVTTDKPNGGLGIELRPSALVFTISLS